MHRSQHLPYLSFFLSLSLPLSLSLSYLFSLLPLIHSLFLSLSLSLYLSSSYFFYCSWPPSLSRPFSKYLTFRLPKSQHTSVIHLMFATSPHSLLFPFKFFSTLFLSSPCNYRTRAKIIWNHNNIMKIKEKYHSDRIFSYLLLLSFIILLSPLPYIFKQKNSKEFHFLFVLNIWGVDFKISSRLILSSTVRNWNC